MTITKASLKTALGLKNDAELARFFGTTKQAVSQWGADSAPIPAGRQWEARAKRPDAFAIEDPQDNND